MVLDAAESDSLYSKRIGAVALGIGQRLHGDAGLGALFRIGCT